MLPRPRAHLPGRHPCQRAFALTRRRGDHGSQQREARRHLHWQRSVRTRPNFGEEERTGLPVDEHIRTPNVERSSPEAVLSAGCAPRGVSSGRNLQKLAPSWLPTETGARGVRYGSGGSELQRQDRPHSPACRGGRMLGRTRFRAGAAEKRHDERIHVADERRVCWPVQMLWSPRPLYDDRGCPSSHDVPLQASRLRGPTTL